METETRKRAVNALAGLAQDAARDLLRYRSKKKQMERELEIEKELAKAKRQAEIEAEREAGSTEGSTEGVSGGMDATIEEMRSETNCGLCEEILGAIKRADPSLQAQALVEYGKLRDAIEDGASEERFEQILSQSEALGEVMDKHLSAAAV